MEALSALGWYEAGDSLMVDASSRRAAALVCSWDGGLLVRLLSRLGCRVSECLGITVKDVNFAKGTVTIEHLKTRFKLACPRCNARLGRSHAFCPKCGAKVEEAVVGTKEHQQA